MRIQIEILFSEHLSDLLQSACRRCFTRRVRQADIPLSDYNLRELKIALDPNSSEHILPPPLPASSKVLDVGCGAGQSLIAAYRDRVSFGIDTDLDALKLGRSLTDRVRFANGRAEALPFKSGQFDFVFARVSLPYTNISVSLREIHRVLKKGGKVWLTLHSFAIPWRQVRTSNYKGKIFFLYIVINSFFFISFNGNSRCWEDVSRFRPRAA